MPRKTVEGLGSSLMIRIPVIGTSDTIIKRNALHSLVPRPTVGDPARAKEASSGVLSSNARRWVKRAGEAPFLPLLQTRVHLSRSSISEIEPESDRAVSSEIARRTKRERLRDWLTRCILRVNVLPRA